MIWFTSDFHLGHKNLSGPTQSKWIDSEECRNFASVEEMDSTIIKTLNKYVKWDDTLYFLGDFNITTHNKIPTYRDQIHCQTIHFIKGNHDSEIDRYPDKFTSIDMAKIVETGSECFYLSHYAHRVWYRSHKGTIHLYGHSHDTINDHGKSMDIGIDVAYRMFGEYRPFSLDEIREIMKQKKVVIVDSHGKRKL